VGSVNHLDARALIHQDIKPENVLVDDQCRPRLIDLGLALWRDSGSDGPAGAGWTGGTAAIMSPEQALGLFDRVGPWTDVFGLGGVLYHLLTGRPLFQGISYESVCWQGREAEYVPVRQVNRRVPLGLERICHKTLAADPKRRYDTAAELERVLRRFLARRRIVSAGLVILAVMTIGLVVVGARPASTPSRTIAFEPKPFRFGGDPPQWIGWIGFFPPSLRDDAELGDRARCGGFLDCYLIALDADGKVQLRLLPQSSATPSASSSEPGLSDEPGVQVFLTLGAARGKP
jgi:serine/threonine protein kinase